MTEILLVGCVHAGAKAANIDWFKQYINVAKTKKQRIILLGDLLEMATPGRGEGMMWEQDATGDEQMEEITEILRPVADQIDAAVTSNHSERAWKETGIIPEKWILKAIGVKDSVYKGQQGVVVIEGKKIVVAHGHGSGSNEWGDAKKLLSTYPTADIIALSHKHELQMKWHGNIKLTEDGKMVKKYVPFVRTGSLMDWPKYAQKELYTPQKPGFAYITLGSEGRINVNVDGI